MTLEEFEVELRSLIEEEFHISEESIEKIVDNAVQHREETECKLPPSSIVSKMQDYGGNVNSDPDKDTYAERSWNYAIKSLDASGWETGDNPPEYDTDKYKI